MSLKSTMSNNAHILCLLVIRATRRTVDVLNVILGLAGRAAFPADVR